MLRGATSFPAAISGCRAEAFKSTANFGGGWVPWRILDACTLATRRAQVWDWIWSLPLLSLALHDRVRIIATPSLGRLLPERLMVSIVSFPPRTACQQCGQSGSAGGWRHEPSAFPPPCSARLPGRLAADATSERDNRGRKQSPRRCGL